jgi:hypothetical protein
VSLLHNPLITGRLPVHGLPIIWSVHALKATDERLFPFSKHRSRRIHKKLVKRFGGEFRKVPAIFQTPQGLIIHPALRKDIEAAFEKKRRENYDRNFFGSFA